MSKERDIETAALIEILLLAIIQGITEWLPISSSGHLVVAQEYMGLRLPVFFDVILHLGSLVVVLVAFRSVILSTLRAIFHLDFKSEEGKLAVYVALGSIATAVVGFVFRGFFESFFSNLLAVAFAFMVTGSLLFISERVQSTERPLNRLDAVLIGIAQGVALIPGISRSGITITTALRRRIRSQVALTFSFLLFVPAVLGVTVLTGIESASALVVEVDLASMLLGLLTTVVVGYVSLRLMLKIVLKGRMHFFAYYCWTIGFVVVLAQVF